MDDDDVPPLEATRRRCDAKEGEVTHGKSPEKTRDEGEEETFLDEKNEVAEAMMQRALAAREQKRKETEESRRKANGFGGGLKKGFLSSKSQAGNAWKCSEEILCSNSFHHLIVLLSYSDLDAGAQSQG